MALFGSHSEGETVEEALVNIKDTELLSAIRDIVRNQDSLIIGPLKLLTMTELQQHASSLLQAILEDNLDIQISGRLTPKKLRSLQKFKPNKWDDPADEEEGDGELDSLLTEGRYDEAFTLVIGDLRNLVIFEDIEIIFDLAVKTDRLDDLVSLQPIYGGTWKSSRSLLLHTASRVRRKKLQK